MVNMQLGMRRPAFYYEVDETLKRYLLIWAGQRANLSTNKARCF